MTDYVAIESSEPLTKLNYSVLLEKVKDGLYAATVWSLPDCKATGATRDEALENVRQLLTARLEKAEIVSLEMEMPKPEHLWMKFAGKYKDDPPTIRGDAGIYRSRSPRTRCRNGSLLSSN